MQDASIIARRLKDGRIQYARNIGSCFNNMTSKLLQFYNIPQRVDHLFWADELGRKYLWATTERMIFHRYPLVADCYFYDLDEQWYYITSGPLHIKISLKFLCRNLCEEANVFDFVSRVIEKKLLQYIFGQYGKRDSRFNDLCDDKLKADIQVALERVERPFYKLFECYPYIYVYFDDWVVVETDEKNETIVGFKVRSRTDRRRETIEW